MGERGAILREIDAAGQKFVGLTRVMPESTLGWRPAEGVRSVREVYLHIIGNNYNLAYGLGGVAPAESGITQNYNSVIALEAQEFSSAELQARMTQSFEFLRGVVAEMDDASLDDTVNFFGEQRERRSVLALIATHMHEHLGQSIAYARMNGVTPPWSN